MSIKKIEIQDDKGNIYYFHTDSSIVKHGKDVLSDVISDLIKDSSPSVYATGTNDYICECDKINNITRNTKCTLYVSNKSTGPCTLSINGSDAYKIKDCFGDQVSDLKVNIPYNLCHNGMDFILLGKGGGGNAEPEDVLEGKTFTNRKGTQEGSMSNRGKPEVLLNCGGEYRILKGYYEGGKIIVNSLSSHLSDDTLLLPEQLVLGIKAHNKDGDVITGTADIESLGGAVYESGKIDTLNAESSESIELPFEPSKVFGLFEKDGNKGGTFTIIPQLDSLHRRLQIGSLVCGNVNLHGNYVTFENTSEYVLENIHWYALK